MLNRTQLVVESLNQAKDAQQQAQNAIDKADKDIESARNDMISVNLH